jgi:hypothetical protein
VADDADLSLLPLAGGSLSACSPGGGAFSEVHQVDVFAALKAVAMRQNLHGFERGEYAPTLAQLRRDFSNPQTERIAAAALSSWLKLEMRSPQVAGKEAQALIDGFDAGRR